MMPILGKGDDVKGGTKAKARHGRIRAARESMNKQQWSPRLSSFRRKRLLVVLKVLEVFYLQNTKLHTLLTIQLSCTTNITLTLISGRYYNTYTTYNTVRYLLYLQYNTLHIY